jgi:hypothetical protein
MRVFHFGSDRSQFAGPPATIYDIGVRADTGVAVSVYSAAGLAGIAAAVFLFRL